LPGGALYHAQQVARPVVPLRQAVLATLILGGLRAEELCLLQREAVDLRDHAIFIREKPGSPGEAKTAAGVRRMPMSRYLHTILDSYAAMRSTQTSVFFPTRKGTKLGVDNLREQYVVPVIERANAKLGATDRPLIMSGVTTQSLRRTCVTLLLAAGENPANVIVWVGHADFDVTMSRYAQAAMGSRDMEIARRLLWTPGEHYWDERSIDVRDDPARA